MIGEDWTVTSDNIAQVNVLNGHGDEENLRSNDSREVHDWSEWREIPGYDVDDGEANLHTTTTTSDGTYPGTRLGCD
jgi:hypothetical protein